MAKKQNNPQLHPVERLAEAAGLKGWEMAALLRAAGWSSGKQVTESDFNDALARLRARPQGGGKI